MSNTIPWYKVGRTERGSNPFTSLGLDWCPRCKIEVDTDTEAHHNDGIYVYRRQCLRCGRTIKYGAYRVPLINNTVGPALPPKVFLWINEPGKDRR